MLISEGFTCLEANWVETVPFCLVFTFINLTANLEVPQPCSTLHHSIRRCPGSLSPEYRLLAPPSQPAWKERGQLATASTPLLEFPYPFASNSVLSSQALIVAAS